MDLKFVETLVGVLERSKALGEIEFRSGARHVTLKRRSSRSISIDKAGEPPSAAASSSPAMDGSCTEVPSAASSRHNVTAGMTGTFYRSPAPNQPVFVSVGDPVEAGQTLALVEAMKLLNPIEAVRAGTIAEILVADGAAISSDTPLFVIQTPEEAHV